MQKITFEELKSYFIDRLKAHKDHTLYNGRDWLDPINNDVCAWSGQHPYTVFEEFMEPAEFRILCREANRKWFTKYGNLYYSDPDESFTPVLLGFNDDAPDNIKALLEETGRRCWQVKVDDKNSPNPKISVIHYGIPFRLKSCNKNHEGWLHNPFTTDAKVYLRDLISTYACWIMIQDFSDYLMRPHRLANELYPAIEKEHQYCFGAICYRVVELWGVGSFTMNNIEREFWWRYPGWMVFVVSLVGPRLRKGPLKDNGEFIIPMEFEGAEGIAKDLITDCEDHAKYEGGVDELVDDMIKRFWRGVESDPRIKSRMIHIKWLRQQFTNLGVET